MPSEYTTPLARKLGVREGDVVALAGAPDGFVVSDLPAGAALRHGLRGKADLTIWFVRDRAALEHRIGAMAPRAEHSGLWIAWPKRGSRLGSDLSDDVVRETALGAGLVDFKVCSIDDDWSGLRFNRRNHNSKHNPKEET